MRPVSLPCLTVAPADHVGRVPPRGPHGPPGRHPHPGRCTCGAGCRRVPEPGPRVGFVVSKAVGNAVTRNRVKRRLRHLARERLDVAARRAAVLVVRALPAAAAASYAELGGATWTRRWTGSASPA